MKLLNRARVVAEILLASNKDDGVALAEVKNLGDPLLSTGQLLISSMARSQVLSHLLLDVVKGIRRVDGETDENHVRVWV